MKLDYFTKSHLFIKENPYTSVRVCEPLLSVINLTSCCSNNMFLITILALNISLEEIKPVLPYRTI